MEAPSGRCSILCGQWDGARTHSQVSRQTLAANRSCQSASDRHLCCLGLPQGLHRHLCVLRKQLLNDDQDCRPTGGCKRCVVQPRMKELLRSGPEGTPLSALFLRSSVMHSLHTSGREGT